MCRKALTGVADGARTHDAGITDVFVNTKLVTNIFWANSAVKPFGLRCHDFDTKPLASDSSRQHHPKMAGT